MREASQSIALCALIALVGSCGGGESIWKKRASEPLVPLRDARIAVIPFAYRSYLPFEHEVGRELSQAVRAALAPHVPQSAVFVESAKVEAYLRSTVPEMVDRSQIAATLDADVILMGTIRLIQTTVNPPPDAYAGIAVVAFEVFDARSGESAFSDRLEIRLRADELTEKPLLGHAVVRTAVLEQIADLVGEAILSPKTRAEGSQITKNQDSKTIGEQE